MPWYAGETVSVAIGQGQVSVTPLQMARVAGVIASGGRLAQPHLVKAIGGEAVSYPAPQPIGLRPETIEAIRNGMRAVVDEHGSGWRAQLPDIRVAGKTGSAQVVTKARLALHPSSVAMLPHGWFIAFAPADHPRIALAVLLEHGGSGGGAAAPVAREILEQFFFRAGSAARSLVASSAD